MTGDTPGRWERRIDRVFTALVASASVLIVLAMVGLVLILTFVPSR